MNESLNAERMRERVSASSEASLACPTTIALALLVDGMHEAATLYASDRTAAIAHMTIARERIAAVAASSADAGLAIEAELADDLLTLMVAGARQGMLYGY